MKLSRTVALVLAACALSACGGNKDDSADRQNEAQKAIEQGMQKEKAMVEGMQKGVQDLEKKTQEGSQENQSKK